MEKLRLRQVTGFCSTLQLFSLVICLGVVQIHKQSKMAINEIVSANHTVKCVLLSTKQL